MMKRKFLLAGVTSAFLLTGCVQQNTDVEIHADGSADVSQTYMLSEEMTKVVEKQGESVADGMLEGIKPSFKEEGAIVSEYEKDGKKGVKVDQSFLSLNKMFESGFFATYDKEGKPETAWDVKVDEGFFATTTSIKAEVDYDKWVADAMEVSEDEVEMLGEVGSSLELNYSFTTPTKAFSHNADQEDNRTYSWNVEPHEKKTIELEYHVLKMTNVLVSSVMGVVALFALTFFLKNRRKK